MDQFVINNLQETAFMADDNETQHAMNAKVFSPSQISEIFDSISYGKGKRRDKSLNVDYKQWHFFNFIDC